MARKKPPEEHENHERWLVSYADFITLLFAFFVVMYSISSVNEGKYRVMSNSLVVAFGKPGASLNPIQLGKPNSTQGLDSAARKRDSSFIPLPMPEIPIDEGGAKDRQMKRMEQEIKRSMKGLIDKDLVKVRRNKKGVEVEIKSSVLFASGSARLQIVAIATLSKIAKILARQNYNIQVEGFTDNVPINTIAFPSNWELSAARSASVVHLFTRNGVEPQRMAAIGFGEYRPVTSNQTEQGKNRNRRVVVVIRPTSGQRRFYDPVNVFNGGSGKGGN